ncbi:MAG: RHS domain-containing protein [Myxococcales bacterium]|nr:RHS domain-containing protein [Myxococcales bacterium]
MLVSTWFDPVIGVDIHIDLVPTPGGPVPTPLPNPFVGLVIDPVAMSIGMATGANTVLVNSMPVTNVGSNVTSLMGGPHIPVPGPFAKPPSNDAELMFGGLNVSMGGSFVCRMGEIALSCFDPSGRAPVSVVMAIPKGPPVLVLRPPAPDVTAVAMRLGMKAASALVGKALKLGAKLFKESRIGQFLGRRFTQLTKYLQRKMSVLAGRERSLMDRLKCFVTGHPVDVATGRMFTDNVDFELPGPLPLTFSRVYDSSLSWRQGPLGAGWYHSLDVAVWAERGRMVLRSEQGREIEFPTWDLRDRVLEPGMSVYHDVERATLRCTGPSAFELETQEGLLYSFGPVPGSSEFKLLRKARRDGAAHLFSYDAFGRLATVRDSAGRLVHFAYDDSGHLARVAVAPKPEIAPSRLMRFEVDAQGDLVSAEDALAGQWTYEYRHHLMVRETNRNGLSFYFIYDGIDPSARCVRTWGDDGIYDHAITYTGGATLVEDSLGHVTLYKLDESGQVIAVLDATGAETKYEYHPVTGQKTAEIMPDGVATRWSYNDRGLCTRVEGPDGATLLLESDEAGRPLKAVDPMSGVWQWRHDAAGRPLGRRDPLGRTVQFQWEGTNLVAVTDPSGQQVSLAYDAAGNLVALTMPDGNASRWQWDVMGRCVASIDPRGNAQLREFDVLGRITRILEPDGNERVFSYDAEGNVVAAKDRHHDVRFTYQGMNRLRKREEAGTAVRFAYDKEERLLGVQNEHGLVYQFVLGPTGLVAEEWGFDRRRRAYLRDPAGRVTQVIRPNGETTAYEYDKAGRVLAAKHSDGTEERFGYRADGELVRASNADAHVVLERDVLGRVVKELQGSDWVVSTYDTLGYRTRLTSSKGLQHNIRRNGMGDVLGVSAHIEAGGNDLPFEFSAPDSGGANPYEVSFERDSVGLELGRKLPGGVAARWERDTLGRPVRQSLEVNGQELRARVYKWEPDDRLSRILDSASGPIFFEHDALGSLAAARSEDASGNAVIDLRMPDAVGNLFRMRDRGDRKYGPSGELLEATGREGVTRYAYDIEGNLIRKEEPGGRVWTYAWNGAGRLAKVVRPDGAEVTFGYDPLGRRVWKQWRHKRTRWIWDGNVPLHEWVERVGEEGEEGPDSEVPGADASAQARQEALLTSQPAQGPPGARTAQRPAPFHLAAAAAGTPEHPVTYLFDPESFAPMAKLVGDEKLSIITDHLGTPTTMLDELGRVVWQADITVWGDLRNVRGIRSACPFRWPGQYEDEETGLYYNRFRYYDPDAGEYVSRDPIGLAGGAGPYGYVHDPSTWKDPAGLAGISDDAWVRYDPSVYDSSIEEFGIKKSYFEDGRVWLTKYRDVKEVANARELEQKLYRKNLWKKVDKKFADGGTLRVIENVDDAKFAGITNKSTGVRQWYIERDIPASDMKVVKKTPGECRK